MEIISKDTLKSAKDRIDSLKIYLDIENRSQNIAELEEKTHAQEFWDDATAAQKILKEIKSLKDITEPWQQLKADFDNIDELYEFSIAEDDSDMLQQITQHYDDIERAIDKLEFIRKLSGEDDLCDAIITIHSGAGGTESCDWALMLYRMYSRWIERHGYKSSIMEYSEGDEAGIKSVSIEVKGDYIYGHLKAEAGVHRLVRISPFDSNARRHTSFASVYAYPIFEDVDDYQLDEKDIRTDTYRASGAGGQHVNKTDSAVRMTHIPTNIVVQCQNERSQIKNREACLKMLKARVRQFYKEEEERKRADKLEDKKKIEWGSQIRSYVLHPYNMVKDHRTDYETSNTTAVLDGEIDEFIERYLLQLS
jgi:peptide chain release factor 2